MKLNTGFRINNKSKKPIWVFISNYSNNEGSDEWYVIRSGCSDLWVRSSFEVVVVRFSEDHNDRKGFYTYPSEISVYENRVIR